MKKLHHFLLLIVITLSATSCATIVPLISIDSTIGSSVRLYNDSTSKSIVIMPMLHVGTPEHYKNLGKILDSLRADGYVIYYEGVRFPSDSLQCDTVRRKIRRLFKQDVVAGYNNKKNKSVAAHNKLPWLVEQDYNLMGLKEHEDLLVDMTAEQVIAKYERQIGKPIKLTQYDFDTPLTDKYQPNDSIYYSGFISLNINRNEFLIDRILSSDDRKIVVVYGMSHKWFLMANLRDQSYTLDSKYKLRKILNEIKKRERQAARESKKPSKK